MGTRTKRLIIPFQARPPALATSKPKNTPPEPIGVTLAGLAKTWAVQARKRRGEIIVPVRKMIKKRKRARIKLKETLAREAREIQEMARMQAESVMQRLHAIIKDPESRDSDAIAAGQAILDRAYGRATQTNVNANIDANVKETEISSTELDKRIKTALNRVESIAGRASKTGEGEERPPDVCEHDRDTGGSTVH